MNKEERAKLLKGLDEYYTNRSDLLTESNDFQIIEINSLRVREIKDTIADYAREHIMVNIQNIQWQG